MDFQDKSDGITVVAQCADNQWLPADLARPWIRAARTGAATLFDLAALHQEASARSRDEFIRALIHARRVVVNRAYLHNNFAIREFYAGHDPESREHFAALMADSTIVPYLFNELSPTDRPRYSVSDEVWRRWSDVCTEAADAWLLRLAWPTTGEDLSTRDNNGELTKQLISRPFTRFVRAMDEHDLDAFLQDLGHIREDVPGLRGPFRERLLAVGDFARQLAAEDKPVTRDALYGRFVIADGEPTDSGILDSAKAFALEIKELIDLRYNTTLPDAIGGFSLTPRNALTRTSLQEIFRPSSTGAEDTEAMLERLLRQATFDAIQVHVPLPDLSMLSLGDIRWLRKQTGWAEYMQSVGRVVSQSNLELVVSEPSVLNAVFEAHARMMRELAEFKRPAGPTAGDFVAALVIEIGLTAITTTFMPGSPPVVEISTVPLAVWAERQIKSVRVVYRLSRLIRGRVDEHAQDIELGRLPIKSATDARTFIVEIVRRLEREAHWRIRANDEPVRHAELDGAEDKEDGFDFD